MKRAYLITIETPDQNVFDETAEREDIIDALWEAFPQGPREKIKIYRAPMILVHTMEPDGD